MRGNIRLWLWMMSMKITSSIDFKCVLYSHFLMEFVMVWDRAVDIVMFMVEIIMGECF